MKMIYKNWTAITALIYENLPGHFTSKYWRAKHIEVVCSLCGDENGEKCWWQDMVSGGIVFRRVKFGWLMLIRLGVEKRRMGYCNKRDAEFFIQLRKVALQ